MVLQDGIPHESDATSLLVILSSCPLQKEEQQLSNWCKGYTIMTWNIEWLRLSVSDLSMQLDGHIVMHDND